MNDTIMVTVLTPTYNRAKTLPRLIESLCGQTSTDFQWLVIDDGSTDDTDSIFEELKKYDLPFQWEYYKKENGGKHTALNFSHPYIKGEVVLILDSDDYLTSSAIETVEEEWPQYRNQVEICGMSFFKGKEDGSHLSVANAQDVYIDDDIHYRVNQKIKGDRCEVVRTDLLKKYPFPVYPGERFFSEGWLWTTLAMNYKTVYRNKIIYICEYLEGGLTKSGRPLRMRNPLGAMDNCRSYLNERVCFKSRFKEMLLYWVYSRCAGYSLKKVIMTSGRTIEMVIAMPFGLMLYVNWKNKYLN